MAGTSARSKASSPHPAMMKNETAIVSLWKRRIARLRPVRSGNDLAPGSAVHHFVLRPAPGKRSSVIEKRPKFPAPRRMLQLPQRLGFDLTNAFARHRELL